MKTIQFTDEEIQSLEGFTAISSAASKIKLAKKMPDGSTLSDDALLFYVTPSEAVEEVCDRRKAAREENEKRATKQMISDLVESNSEATSILQGFISSPKDPTNHALRSWTDRAKDFINNKLF